MLIRQVGITVTMKNHTSLLSMPPKEKQHGAEKRAEKEKQFGGHRAAVVKKEKMNKKTRYCAFFKFFVLYLAC